MNSLMLTLIRKIMADVKIHHLNLEKRLIFVKRE
jgi:hypothetical protein